ncbi:MAG: hypothetical protein K9L60_08830 [Methylovulum sp.]|jgi:hypothetical protein|nr:hypothetical protein [Methylovulum sp.]MCF8007381.1 hypothetical protein [Methylovulum sp.]
MSAMADEIWAILRETVQEQQENSRQIAALRASHQDIAKEQQENSRQIATLRASHQDIAKEQQENSRQIAALQASQQETNDTLKRVGVDFGSMKKNQGDIAEEFFFNSLIDDPHLGEIYFDDITKSQCKHRGNVQEEYDIVMTNGTAIGIIEVKYKAHEKDVDKLERKMKNFKKLFPVYNHCRLYGALASFHFYDEAKENALARGFFVLQRSGNVVQTKHGENLLVL